MPRSLAVVLLMALVLLAGCGSSGGSSGGAGRGHATTSSPAPSFDRPPVKPVQKLLVVIEENHSLSQMRSGMPYTFSLAQHYGYATDYHALAHPSLPNYLAIAGGQMFGVQDDAPPSAHPVGAPSVFGQALAAGTTAGAYLDAMPAPCAQQDSGSYAVRHNPWAYFTTERRDCLAHDKPIAALAPDVAAGRLPQVSMVVPDTCHDAHDCPLSTADAWFQRLMTTVTSGPDWRSGHLAVVLTADEDDHDNQGNIVLTTVIHPSQSHHVVSTRLTHYSLTRLYDEVAGLPPLGEAAAAPSMAKAFGLPLS